ncbi:MAG: hypothetical protein LBI48_11015 [Burkholderiaceae bacterium]|jgi:hypothetical protein|nr:hypothetical protein [Burkholderiaceae bacterium]
MIDPAFVALIIVGLVGAFFVIGFIAPSKKAKVEINAPMLYQERCSVYITGMLGINSGGIYPLCRVSFYDSFLVISSFYQWVIHYEEIVAVHKSGKMVEFLRRTEPRKIRISTKCPDKMVHILLEKANVRSDEST